MWERAQQNISKDQKNHNVFKEEDQDNRNQPISQFSIPQSQGAVSIRLSHVTRLVFRPNGPTIDSQPTASMKPLLSLRVLKPEGP